MSMLNFTIPAFDDRFVKLSGPNNFDTWYPAFKTLANVYGCFDLYLSVKDTSQPDFLKSSAPDAPQNCAYNATIYNARFVEWKHNHKRFRSARALLYAAVKPWIWNQVVTDDTTHPQKIWDAIIKANKPPDFTREKRARAKLDAIKMQDFENISKYFGQLEIAYNTIIDAKGYYTRALLIKKINDSLPRQYAHFVQYWRATHCNQVIDDKVFGEYRERLTNYKP